MEGYCHRSYVCTCNRRPRRKWLATCRETTFLEGVAAPPPLPKRRLLLLPGTPVLISIINTKKGATEGGDFAKADEQRLVNLPLRVDVYSAKEQHQPSNGQHRGCDQLNVKFHSLLRLKKT